MNEELKNIFLAEAHQQREQLNQLFTSLEKKPQDVSLIEAIFRLMHTLKANAAAMGFEPIAEMAHLIEDIFSVIKKNTQKLNTQIFNDLFRANDKIGELIDAIQTQATVNYKGLTTRLKVILRELQQENENTSEKISPITEKIALEKIEKEDLPEAEEVAVEMPSNESKSLAMPTLQAEMITVPVKKLDNLLNLVEELSIEKDYILTLAEYEENQILKGKLSRLQRITSDLQYSVMGVRLVQMNVLFQKFYRIVRDIAQLEGKEVDLILEGTEIEIDRNILQIISDSMVHLVRNAVSHGIESPEIRKRKGKKSTGVVLLKATSEKNTVTIEVTDDGKGIDIAKIKAKIIEKKLLPTQALNALSEEEVMSFIFESGFSSAEKITEVSGRGIGMDVVKRTVESVGGKVSIVTQPDEGTSVRLHLPASMAVKPALLFELNQQTFALPIHYTEAVVAKTAEQLLAAGSGLVIIHLGKSVPVVFLKDLLAKENLHTRNFVQSRQNLSPSEKVLIIIIYDSVRKVGLVVDKLLHQKEIIEKPLKAPLRETMFISGATILGNGNVCLVIDVPTIFNFLFNNRSQYTIKNDVKKNI
ncbi:MAG: ATP-binding protein [Bacteroidia bacterium]|nr:ATP-binding protein [Bacteroidia bacterium]MDW8300834.1 ATP-binding protein [Bacteroidia bacterium]